MTFTGFLKSLCCIAMMGLAHSASAATATADYGIQSISDPNVPAGYNSHEIFWNGNGLDWTSTVLRIDLSAGSFYQDPFGADGPQPTAFYPLFPSLEFDTFVGIPDDSTGAIAGGGGDIGGGPLSMDAPQMSVSWFNTSIHDVLDNRLGMLTLSEDATGTGSMMVRGQVTQFNISNGAIPDFTESVTGDIPGGGINGRPGNFPPLLGDRPTYNETGVSTRVVIDPDVPDGYVANRLIWNGNGIEDWNAAALRVDLTRGDVFHHALGSDSPPDPALFDAYPDLKYDTYVGILGDDTGEITGGAITGAGGADILGGGPHATLELPYLTAAWQNDPGSVETGHVDIGMLTFSQHTTGRIGFYAHGRTWSADIIGGRITPEPATAIVLMVVCPFMFQRRRTSHILPTC